MGMSADDEANLCEDHQKLLGEGSIGKVYGYLPFSPKDPTDNKPGEKNTSLGAVTLRVCYFLPPSSSPNTRAVEVGQLE